MGGGGMESKSAKANLDGREQRARRKLQVHVNLVDIRIIRQEFEVVSTCLGRPKNRHDDPSSQIYIWRLTFPLFSSTRRKIATVLTSYY